MPDELQQIIPASNQITSKFYQEVRSREAWARYCEWYYITSERHRQELQQMRGELKIIGWFYRNRSKIAFRMAVLWVHISLGGIPTYHAFDGSSQGSLSPPSSLPPIHHTPQPYAHHPSRLSCPAQTVQTLQTYGSH